MSTPDDPEDTDSIEAQWSYLKERYGNWEEALQKKKETLGPPPGIDASSLASAHWGVILPEEPLDDHETAIWSALQPLVELRKKQTQGKVRILRYKKGQTYSEFLWEAGPKVTTGNMRVDFVPYYLCIVGAPQRIPWDIQITLDGEYAVGRIWFDDPLDAEKYVDSLLAQKSLTDTVHALFTSTDDDELTRDAKNLMIEPIYHEIGTLSGVHADFILDATVANVGEMLTGKQKEARFVMTASHGSATVSNLGALKLKGGFLSAEIELEKESCCGLIYWAFACFSAGGPDVRRKTAVPLGIDAAVMSALPQKLLASGASALIGYVGTVADYSFLGPTRKTYGPQAQVLKVVIQQILEGVPVGHALDYLNQQTRSWGAAALNPIVGAVSESEADEFREAYMDALGMVLLGDPAIRQFEASPTSDLATM